MKEALMCLGIPITFLILLVAIRFWIYSRRMKHGEVLSVDVMKEKYDLTIENYKPPKTDLDAVPKNLRDLLPLAEKWGIGDDIIREDLQEKALDDEKKELENALKGRWNEITAWLDSFGNNLMPVEAAMFMYMQLGCDEMGLIIDEEENS